MRKKIFLISLSIFFCSAVFAQSKAYFFEKGLEFLMQKQYQKSVVAFAIFIEIDPDNGYVYKNRGVALMKLKKYDLAIQDFEKAKSILPNLKGIHSNLGAAWYCKKEYEKAIENYSLELNLNPEKYSLFFNRALCYAELKQNEKALEDVSRTLELKPDFTLALCFKGDILIRLEEAKQASKDNKSEPNQKFKIEPKKTSTKLTGKSALQVGAFLNKEFAIELEKKLARNGYDSRILIIQGARRETWHLVRVGLFSNSADAKPLILSLKEKMSLNAITRPAGAF